MTGNHQTIKPGAIVTSGSNAVRGVMVLWLGRGRAGPSVRPERPVMSAQVRSVMVLWFYRHTGHKPHHLTFLGSGRAWR